MNMYDIILGKRKGRHLSKEEIRYFVKGYTRGDIPDYQASALLMTFFFNELSYEEVYYLTDAMRDSGDTVDLSAINGIKVDKHSTGGVGDKTTLIVAPLAAACGVPIAKMSGRGLGFTGGTVDKMEAIPGMRTTLSRREFVDQVNRIGIAVIGQTGSIAPADKKIYALRDVTATVDSMGLIASSIMSKKLASGSDAIILDIKCGNGAFMANMDDAAALGEMMTGIGKKSGKKTIAVITDMNQPLGRGIGNSIEVIEAIETLKGRGPDDITELSLELAAQMIIAGGIEQEPGSAERKVHDALYSGRGLIKFQEFVAAQGGDPSVTDDYLRFGEAALGANILCKERGFVGEVKAGIIGHASQRAGAGRATKDDELDMNAGIVLHKKVGDRIEKGQVLATVYGGCESKLNDAAVIGNEAFVISNEAPDKTDLIKKIIG